MKLTKKYIQEKVREALSNLSEGDEKIIFVDDDLIMNNLVLSKTKTPFKLKKGGVVVYWEDNYEIIVRVDENGKVSISRSTDDGEEIIGKLKLAPYSENVEKQISFIKNRLLKIMKGLKSTPNTQKLREIVKQEILKIKEANENVSIEIEVPSWLKDKLEDIHVKPGQGSIFSKPIPQVLRLVQDLLDKTNPDKINKIANSTGTLTMDISGIGYNLVLPIEQAKKLQDAQESETEKVEGPNKIKVPLITTTSPLSKFKSNKLTVIIRPKRDGDRNVIPNEYIVLSAFPGNPDIPRASEWDGKYAIIVPTTSKLREIVKQEILKIKEANEKASAEQEITEDQWEMINAAVNGLTKNYSKVHRTRLSALYDIDDLISDADSDKGLRDEIVRRDNRWLRAKFPKIYRNRVLKQEFNIAFQSEMEAGRYV